MFSSLINNIVDIISEYTQNWLEDNINEDLYEKGYETSNKFKDYESFDSKVNEVFSAIQESRIKMFKDKFETVKLQ